MSMSQPSDPVARMDPRRRAALERLRAAVAHIPVERVLSDELIAERRAEAALEDEWAENTK